jgi:hypothetical protein
MRPPKIGDVIEIPTSRGFAYAQVTHRKPSWGFLLRVIEGYWQERPTDFLEVVLKPTRFLTFYPVGSGIHRGVVSHVANVVVPLPYRKFPLFRDRMHLDHGDWWLWDGEKEWRLGPDLPPEYRGLSYRLILNDIALVERVTSDYRPDDGYRTPLV